MNVQFTAFDGGFQLPRSIKEQVTDRLHVLGYVMQPKRPQITKTLNRAPQHHALLGEILEVDI